MSSAEAIQKVLNTSPKDIDRMLWPNLKPLFDEVKATLQAPYNNINFLTPYILGDKDYERSLEYLDKMMAYNSAEAEKNRQFQEHMSNTSYQRQMQDLRKAGINPMLVINSGGASSPSGSSASVNSSYTGNSAQSVMSALSLGVNASIGVLNQSIRSITQIASSAMGLYGNLWRTQFNYDKLYGIARF